MRKRWHTGTAIVMEERWKGRLWSARPMRVVEDRDEMLILWCPRGTRWKAPTTPPTRRREPTRAERFVTSLTHCDWVYADAVWDVDSLCLIPMGAWHEVRVQWRDGGEPWGWYVNLQRPIRRTERGVQTMDLMLDVIVELDRGWRWKDEDELDTLVAAGIVDSKTAVRVRAEGRTVISRVEAYDPPFSQPWHEWKPNPSWPLPQLPREWCYEEGT